jgi:hypothetical protein
VHSREIAGKPLPIPTFLTDYTDAGPVWDPVQSAYYYSWTAPAPPAQPPASNVTAPPLPTRNTATLGTFTPYDSSTPVGWLYFTGRWGDFQYPDSDHRQFSLFGAAHRFESGPTGPAYKNLGRKEVWSTSKGEIIKNLNPGM